MALSFGDWYNTQNYDPTEYNAYAQNAYNEYLANQPVPGSPASYAYGMTPEQWSQQAGIGSLSATNQQSLFDYLQGNQTNLTNSIFNTSSINPYTGQMEGGVWGSVAGQGTTGGADAPLDIVGWGQTLNELISGSGVQLSSAERQALGGQMNAWGDAYRANELQEALEPKHWADQYMVPAMMATMAALTGGAASAALAPAVGATMAPVLGGAIGGGAVAGASSNLDPERTLTGAGMGAVGGAIGGGGAPTGSSLLGTAAGSIAGNLASEYIGDWARPIGSAIGGRIGGAIGSDLGNIASPQTDAGLQNTTDSGLTNGGINVFEEDIYGAGDFGGTWGSGEMGNLSSVVNIGETGAELPVNMSLNTSDYVDTSGIDWGALLRVAPTLYNALVGGGAPSGSTSGTTSGTSGGTTGGTAGTTSGGLLPFLSSIYGYNQLSDTSDFLRQQMEIGRTTADPFSQYRPEAGNLLMQTYRDPLSIYNQDAYQLLDKRMQDQQLAAAAQAGTLYNAPERLAQRQTGFLDYLDKYRQPLMGMSGASGSPATGAAAAAQYAQPIAQTEAAKSALVGLGGQQAGNILSSPEFSQSLTDIMKMIESMGGGGAGVE